MGKGFLLLLIALFWLCPISCSKFPTFYKIVDIRCVKFENNPLVYSWQNDECMALLSIYTQIEPQIAFSIELKSKQFDQFEFVPDPSVRATNAEYEISSTYINGNSASHPQKSRMISHRKSTRMSFVAWSENKTSWSDTVWVSFGCIRSLANSSEACLNDLMCVRVPRNNEKSN